MELVRCIACWGRKVVNGMGGQLRDCPTCKATGYTEKKDPKPLSETNPHLVGNSDKLIKRSVETSSNVEGINISEKSVEKIEEHRHDPHIELCEAKKQLIDSVADTLVEKAFTEIMPEVKFQTVEAVPDVTPKKKEEIKPKDRREVAIERGKGWNLTEEMVDAILEEPNIEAMAWRRKYEHLLVDELAAPAYKAMQVGKLPERAARKSFREGLVSEFKPNLNVDRPNLMAIQDSAVVDNTR